MSSEFLVNPVKAKMNGGQPALGLVVRIARTPDIARIARMTGHDFIFIDLQHSIFDLETIANIAQTALALGLATLVRVRGLDDPDVSLMLDNGVAGIVYPGIGTAAEARRAVATCKFPPIGRRTVVGGYPHFDYRSIPQGEAVSQLNDFCLLVCMIETLEGVRNVEEIAAVPGVDVLHVGSNDLLADMGKPGQFADPELIAAQDRVIRASKENGIFSGAGGNRNPQAQADAIRRGARFLTTQTDVGFISAGAIQWVEAVKSAVGPSPAVG